jgi:NIMA (never in mitosis gene a)-related kinase
MKLCDRDLKDILNEYKSKGLPLNLIKKIFIQLNEALKTMKEKGIINKDLKPENILIKYSDNNKTNFDIKLNNFGLSNNESTINNFIKSNTKDYTAPEIDKKNYNDKSLLWSLGVILYELCTNKYIFDADNPKDREKIIELMEKLVKKQVMK